jgi:hypothetical protein
MKKREIVENSSKNPATKYLDNQMFDVDGNILLTNCSSSLRNSFANNHSIVNNLAH